MQELILIHPGGTAREDSEREAAQAGARREFEERLAECGPLAYRVARGVLRNCADAEDLGKSDSEGWPDLGEHLVHRSAERPCSAGFRHD
jgi:hypothetical protein